MLSEFVPLEIIFEIRWSKPMPIDHGSSYRAVTFSRIRCRPNVAASAAAAQDRTGCRRLQGVGRRVISTKLLGRLKQAHRPYSSPSLFLLLGGIHPSGHEPA